MGGVMSSIVISGDTSGAITVAAPAVAGTNTATLPAATGTLMVSGNMPTFSAYSNANQTVTSGTTTKIAFNSEEWDTASCFDSTTNYRFTPNVAGYYQFNSSAQFAFSTVTRMRIELYKNGSLYKRLTDSNSSMNSITGGSLVYMNGSTDYVEIFATISGVGTLTVNGGTADTTWFNGSLVRTA
jgi:hypothetical protein